MNLKPENEYKASTPSPVLEAEDPDNVGAFCEDALTEAEADESTAIPPEFLPEEYTEGE